MGSFATINLIILVFGLILYFLPTIVVARNKHKAGGLVFLVNLLIGWTLIGWIIALIWACSGPFPKEPDPHTPSSETHRACPDCAEQVLKEARKCKHCGSTLVPLA